MPQRRPDQDVWGYEVTAFTSHESKTEEAKGFGAHYVVSSRDSEAMQKIANSLDLLIVTINIPLDLAALLKTLKPKGRLHVVGAVLEPMPIPDIDLIFGQKSVSGSPTGGPTKISTMLDFAARHSIAPASRAFPDEHGQRGA